VLHALADVRTALISLIGCSPFGLYNARAYPKISIMKLLLAIFLGLFVLGGAAFVVINKPFEKREREITIGDLMEQSRRNIPGAAKEGVTENVGSSIAPADYEGTLLGSVPENEQKLVRDGGSEVSFNTYVPTKVPKGFFLRPTSVSHGVQNNVTVFQSFFSHANGDNLFIYQYPLNEYLTEMGQTLAEFTNGKEGAAIDGKTIFIADTGTKTAGRFQYLQGATVIAGATMIRIEYFGEKKLSSSNLTELAASLAR